jgi:hypothetical protein
MKLPFKIIMGAGLALIAIWGCEKNTMEENIPTNNLIPEEVSNYRFIHAYVDTVPYKVKAELGPRVLVYSNSALIGSGSTVQGISYLGTWPSANFAKLPKGINNFHLVMDRVAGSPSVPAPAKGDTVWAFTHNGGGNKYYTVFLTDTFPKPGYFIKEENVDRPAGYKYKVRFVNLAYSSLKDTLEVYSRRNGKVILTDGRYKNLTDWVTLETPTYAQADTFDIRKKGTTTNLYNTFFSPTIGRFYTVYARGGKAGKAAGASAVINY